MSFRRRTRLAAVSYPARPNRLFSDMDLFTVCAIGIVVVVLITIVSMGGWLR